MELLVTYVLPSRQAGRLGCLFETNQPVRPPGLQLMNLLITWLGCCNILKYFPDQLTSQLYHQLSLSPHHSRSETRDELYAGKESIAKAKGPYDSTWGEAWDHVEFIFKHLSQTEAWSHVKIWLFPRDSVWPSPHWASLSFSSLPRKTNKPSWPAMWGRSAEIWD